MHIIYDIKKKIASELAVSDFDSSSWPVDSSTCQLRKMISQTFGPVGDSSAE